MVWWVRWDYRGKILRQSSHSTNRADAVKLLKRKLGEVGRGRVSARFAVTLQDRMRAAEWLADRAFGRPRRTREDEGASSEVPAGEAPDYARLSLDERKRLLGLLRKARGLPAPYDSPATAGADRSLGAVPK